MRRRLPTRVATGIRQRDARSENPQGPHFGDMLNITVGRQQSQVQLNTMAASYSVRTCSWIRRAAVVRARTADDYKKIPPATSRRSRGLRSDQQVLSFRSRSKHFAMSAKPEGPFFRIPDERALMRPAYGRTCRLTLTGAAEPT